MEKSIKNNLLLIHVISIFIVNISNKSLVVHFFLKSRPNTNFLELFYIQMNKQTNKRNIIKKRNKETYFVKKTIFSQICFYNI